jgi:hypothetical protein
MKSFTRLILTAFAMLTLTLSAAWAQVSVTATGGTATGSYTTVSAAFAAINAGTHQGVINLTITANTTEPAAVVALLGSGGTSNYTAVNIKPSGNVTVNSAAVPTSNRGLIELNGADNVTIDGDDPATAGVRNLTFQVATSASTTIITAVIRISSSNTLGTGGANNNTVKNCVIVGSRSSGVQTTMSYGINASNYSTTSLATGAYGNLNTTIDNNEIRRCYRAVHLNGVSTTIPNTGVYVTNNIIGSATLADNVGQCGIFVSYSNITGGTTTSLIEGNDIRCGDVLATGSGFSSTVSGIDLGTVNSGIRVLRNNIHDIIQPTTFGYGANGINISGAAQCENFLIANNMINNIVASKYTTLLTSSFVANGIRFSGGATNARVINNTIVVNAPLNGLTANYVQHGVYCVTTMTFAQFLNNIVVNNGVGAGSYAIYSGAVANISTATVNNNNYWVPSGIIGYYSASNQNTLANWQTATGKDPNTFNVAPNFVNANDLHITTAPTPLESAGAGVGVTLVTNDIDGQVRPGPVGSVNGGASNPDIGADEFDATPIFAPVVTLVSSTPQNCTTATAHAVSVTVTPGSGTVATVVLAYAFNGVAQTPITMTNTSGTTYEATIPVATPINAVVTWGVAASNSFALVTPLTGVSYQDQSLLGISAYASNTASPVCAGTPSGLVVNLGSNNLPTYTNPIVSSPLADEDLGNVTISQGGVDIINNTSVINTLTGTIGTAAGTAGSFSDFTAFGPYTLNAGQTYSLSLSSITANATTNYNNHMRIYIDLNRNGVFTDAGECMFFPAANTLGAHTETGTFTIPASAFNGLTRMRVFCVETTAPGAAYINTFGFGEYEDYAINMVSTTFGGGLVPAITSAAWTDGSTALGTGNPYTINPTATASYTATVTASGCTIVSTPTTVTALVLPTAPVATNSSQCGTAIPTASVASSAGAAGAGQYFWYSAPTAGTTLQTPPTGAYTTFYTNDFTNTTIGAGAILSGVASLTNVAGQLQLTPNALNQLGGITVNAGVNAVAYKVDFDFTATPAGGADGFSYSFGDDVNASSTAPTAEKGSGTKLKISFDAYGAMPNAAGIYLLYNNTLAAFDATTPGVLGYVANTSWVGAATNHATIETNANGQVTVTVNGTAIFTNVQLPAAYLAANKATWRHAIAGRTGGIAMEHTIDNLVIQTAGYAAGTSTYLAPIAATTTFHVAEVGTNGCFSATAPVVVTVSNPDPVVFTAGNNPGICIGQSFTTTASSVNPAYVYTSTLANYAGSGLSASVAGTTIATTPTTAGVYPFTVTATDGICTNVSTMTLTVNALPVITNATATPTTACHNAVVDLTASSIVSGPQTLPAGYCATNNTGTALFNQVTFGTINNNSTTSNPTAAPYYTNYSLTTNVQPGLTYPLTVVNGASSSIISVWIDYNRDGVLAATEWQQVALVAAINATVTINVTIPTTAQMGLTKMRIRSRLSANANGAGDACTSMGSGETEDYLINIQSQPAVPYSYTWNSTPVVNTMVGTTVVTNTTSAPTTQTWTITAVEAATGCVNTMTTAPVTIQPAFLAPVATNSAHCGLQVATASVADPNNFTTPTFNWYATPTSTTALQATTANTYAASVGTTTTLYVTTTNPSTGCQSGPIPVVITVAPAPALTLSSATATNCSTSPSGLVTMVDGLTSYDNFTWTNAATVAGTAAAGYTFNPANATPNAPAATTTYVLTANQTTGQLCQNQATVVVTTNSLPLITSTVANPSAVCSGGTVNLTAASSTLAPVVGVPGPASTGSNTTISYPTPFGNYWWGAKQQFLYTAAELTAAGFTAGTINSLAFDVTTPATQTLTDYAISMKNTTVTALTTTFETGLTQVYYNAAYTPSALTGFANNTITLTPFNWDGTSNVVIDICFNNTAFTTNAVATWTTAFAGAAHFYNADASGVCASTTIGTVTNNRPMIQFTGTTGTNYTPTLAWTWPALNQNGTTASTVVSNPGSTNTTASYTVQATNPITGCSVTNTTAPVTIWALPTINAGNDILICTNNATQQATVTATGAGATGSYVWTAPVAGVQNGVPFTASATGTFSVIGTDGNGCINYDTLQLTYSTVPPASAGLDQAICIGQTATFNATGLAPYDWSMTNYANSGLTGAVANSSVIVVTPTQPGTYDYQVNVSNGVGCTNNDVATLTVYALPVVNAGVDQTICNASPVILAGSGALSYAWNNSVTNATPFFPSSTATYTVVGTDVNGCQNQDQVVVNVLPQPIVLGGLDQTICAGTPIILNASTTSATPTAVTGFQWSNNVTNNTQYVPTTTGTLTVTATGANGCTNQDQILVTVLALPTVNAGQDITVCAGLSATLTATGAVSYAWTNGVTQAIPFYPAATQTYTVVGTGANGCSNNDQVVVNVSTGPVVNLSAPQTVCANSPATLSAAVQNGLGGFWTTTNGFGILTPNVTNSTVTYTPALNDPVVVNLNYVATNACGSASQTTTVTVLPIPVVNAGPDFSVCSGTSATLTATGNGFLTWTTPNVTNGVAFVPAATATYNVVATGFNNCTNNDQVTVTVLALPDVEAGADQTICSGESVTLNGQGAVSYQWTGGAANNVAFAPATTATYTVTGTGVNGCENSDQVTVVVNATPVATVSVVNDVTLAASPAGMNYTWINCASGTDAPNGSTANFTAIANGSYAVIVTSAQGCSDQSDCEIIDAVGLDQIANIEMSVNPNPTAGDLTINMPTELTAQAQVFDAQGKLVLDASNVSNGSVLNLMNMTTGVYMVRISADASVQTFRVVKQ